MQALLAPDLPKWLSGIAIFKDQGRDLRCTLDISPHLTWKTKIKSGTHLITIWPCSGLHPLHLLLSFLTLHVLSLCTAVSSTWVMPLWLITYLIHVHLFRILSSIIPLSWGGHPPVTLPGVWLPFTVYLARLSLSYLSSSSLSFTVNRTVSPGTPLVALGQQNSGPRADSTNRHIPRRMPRPLSFPATLGQRLHLCC